MAAGWRYVALAAVGAGLAAAPSLEPGLPAWPFGLGTTLVFLVASVGALAGARPPPGHPLALGLPWITIVALLAAGAGCALGVERVRAIDRGAFIAEPGSLVELRGFVSGVPRPADGLVVVPVATADGVLALQAPRPTRELQIGDEVRAEGRVREPEPWRAGRLAISGIKRVVASSAVEPTGAARGGISGLVDDIRERSQAALERGMAPAEAALGRGFVLGQDDRIDEATIEDFRRSGLAHLLAVSGQNVLLLALLAVPVLALLGLSLRARLLTVLALIVLYVPVTGAGPSIQRAAVMGIVGVVALLAGRPSRRWYAVLLAAALTLAMNPRAGADVGWQLSFAAVIGIVVWARPISDFVFRLLARPRERRDGSAGGQPADAGGGSRSAIDLRRGFADGAAMTIAATLATAPVSAFHFERISVAAIPANLLALPAVAPIMWLGMLSAGLGQLFWIPVEPLNWLGSLLLAHVAQVAAWFGDPTWATVTVNRLPLAGSAALVGGAGLALSLLVSAYRRRRALAAAPAGRARRMALGLAGTILAGLLLISAEPSGEASTASPGAPHLSITVLDVGQGDAIILDPEPGGAVLIDAGPPGSELTQELAARGIDELAAVIVTHDQSDHSGGLPALLREAPVGAVLHAGAGRKLRLAARAAGARTIRVEQGQSVSAGRLRLEVLWPPGVRAEEAASAEDPNLRSVVLLARWRRFDALLTGDAEAEAVPFRPGAVDLLKVAHHGSEDAGLVALLERTRPTLAVISVGQGNPYGHPHPATLTALEQAGVPTLRTDQHGEIEIEVGREGLRLRH